MSTSHRVTVEAAQKEALARAQQATRTSKHASDIPRFVREVVDAYGLPDAPRNEALRVLLIKSLHARSIYKNREVTHALAHSAVKTKTRPTFSKSMLGPRGDLPRSTSQWNSRGLRSLALVVLNAYRPVGVAPYSMRDLWATVDSDALIAQHEGDPFGVKIDNEASVLRSAKKLYELAIEQEKQRVRLAAATHPHPLSRVPDIASGALRRAQAEQDAAAERLAWARSKQGQ